LIQISLNQVAVNVVDQPDGNKMLAFVDPQSGITIIVPLNEQASIAIRTALGGKSIVVPSAANGAMSDELLRRGGI
jgi:hypothetical protein